MKVVFSECRPDEERYLSPYQVLAYLEAGERPADALAAGFLPSTPALKRFYLSRSVRVDLSRYRADKRIRQVQRKCAAIDHELVPAQRFVLDDGWRVLLRAHMAERWRGANPPVEAFERNLGAAGTTHVLVFIDREANQRVGLSTLYVEPDAVLWRNSIYDTIYLPCSIGHFMLARILETARRLGCAFAYLGNAYRSEYLYKCRSPGTEFFDGWSWCDDRAALRFLIDNQDDLGEEHLVDNERYASWGPVRASIDGLRLRLTWSSSCAG